MIDDGHAARRSTTVWRAWPAGVLLAVCVALWVAVDRGWTGSFDRGGMYLLADGSVALWRAASWSGDTAVRIAVALAACGWLVWRGRGLAALLVAVAVGGGIGLNALAKAVVDRPRPDLLPHLDEVGVLSFPSGHSAGAMVLGLVLASLAGGRGWMLLALGYALVVGLSRVALAVHWPTDIAAGWCLGAAWVLMLTVACDRWRRDRRRGSR